MRSRGSVHRGKRKLTGARSGCGGTMSSVIGCLSRFRANSPASPHKVKEARLSGVGLTSQTQAEPYISYHDSRSVSRFLDPVPKCVGNCHCEGAGRAKHRPPLIRVDSRYPWMTAGRCAGHTSAPAHPHPPPGPRPLPHAGEGGGRKIVEDTPRPPARGCAPCTPARAAGRG